MPLNSPRFSNNKRLQQVSITQPSMKQGEKGEAIAIVQMALVDLGFSMPLTTANGQKLPDGIFGNETARVVRLFQSTNALEPDGVVGPKTLARLEQLIIDLSTAQAGKRRFDIIQEVAFRKS